jgi:hypothetical protein
MSHKELEAYFDRIIPKIETKEPTMFEWLKQLWTKPVEFVEEQDPKLSEDGYWAFEMYTPEWVDETGETQQPVHTVLVEPHEGTWMEVLDKILDAMEAHYGYSIKEQVYYSVAFPMNDVDERTGEPYAGHSRCINDELFQQLLLAHPELYESQMFGKPVKDLYA